MTDPRLWPVQLALSRARETTQVRLISLELEVLANNCGSLIQVELHVSATLGQKYPQNTLRPIGSLDQVKVHEHWLDFACRSSALDIISHVDGESVNRSEDLGLTHSTKQLRFHCNDWVA